MAWTRSLRLASTTLSAKIADPVLAMVIESSTGKHPHRVRGRSVSRSCT